MRLIALMLLPLLLAGCMSEIQVTTYTSTPANYKSYDDKRQAAIHYYGYRPTLTRAEITTPYRNRVTERMLLRFYRVPHDIMCFRHRLPSGSRAVLCSYHRELDSLQRSRHYGQRRTAQLRLLPPHPLFEDPVYTSFRLY